MSQTLEYFKELTKYPRPSNKEEKVREFLIKFFNEKGFKYKVDATGNLIVYVPKKNSFSQETIILQAHMDMVCVKRPESNHNFLTDPIEYYEKDGFLYASETTLGADNGIGIALCMAAVDFESHPNMELVFTINEESGMTGVFGLDFSILSGTKIINIDSECDEEICISSAGGVGIIGRKKLDYEIGNLEKYNIEIFGMKGGHSGIEIDKNRGNAIVLMLNFLSDFENLEVYNINSGYASNVIPSKIKLTLGISDINNFETKLKEALKKARNTYDCPNISYKIEKNDENIKAIKNSQEIIKILSKIKNGVQKMSEKIDGLVETSLNLGILKIENSLLETTYLIRSSNNQDVSDLKNEIGEYLKENSFEVEYDRGYNGWQDNPNSELLKIVKEEFINVSGKEAKITAIHAGLECGSLVSGLKNEKVNAISIGPNVNFAHSVEENVEIKSIYKIEKILIGILKNL